MATAAAAAAPSSVRALFDAISCTSGERGGNTWIEPRTCYIGAFRNNIAPARDLYTRRSCPSARTLPFIRPITSAVTNKPTSHEQRKAGGQFMKLGAARGSQRIASFPAEQHTVDLAKSPSS